MDKIHTHKMRMEIAEVISSWMEGEINNFIKVWLIISASLCFCYYVAKIIPKGPSRLVFIIPVVCLNLLLPLNLHTLHLGVSTAFFLSWLANFKLLMFAIGKGPLSDSSISVSRFVALACLPIKLRQNPTRIIKNRQTTQLYPLKKVPGSVWNYGIKLLLIPLLLRAYGYSDRLHPWLILVLYCSHIYIGLEIILAVVGGLARSVLGVEMEPQFDEPYLSTSLQDFWGRRWNLMVTRILRPSVYEPVLKISAPITGRKWAPLPAIFSTFLVSAIMHELVFFYMGRKWPTGALSCFFLLHGACLMAEVAIKKALAGNRGLPRIIAALLTVGFVMVTAFWLFFPEFLRHNAMVRAFEEYAAMDAFVRDVGRSLRLTSI